MDRRSLSSVSPPDLSHHVCSRATAVEMTCGVFASHCKGGAFVPFPLVERGNPLSNL